MTTELIKRARELAALRAGTTKTRWELNATGHPHIDRTIILRAGVGRGHIETAGTANVIERQRNLQLAAAAPGHRLSDGPNAAAGLERPDIHAQRTAGMGATDCHGSVGGNGATEVTCPSNCH